MAPAAGAVLVTALVVIPPVAARQWTDRVPTMLLLAGGIGCGALFETPQGGGEGAFLHEIEPVEGHRTTGRALGQTAARRRRRCPRH